ncbi:lysophospholipid acyltransferase family protein [Candidatus Thioglobus sp.]|nr:lysophospholipid acyltransferase family protein [Candidatus Thioglobus sp.]
MIRLFLSLCSILPLKINHIFGALIGKLLYIIGSEAKKVSTQNVEICFPELSLKDQKSLVKNSLIHTGKNLTESGLIWNQSFSKNANYVCDFNGENYLDNQKKTILLVPHIGCWELTGRVLANTRKVTFMYKPLRSQKQNDYLFKRRNKGNLTMASADKSGILKVQRALKNNELIGMLPDQDPGEEGGIMSPFFNKEANTMTLLAKIANKNDLQVLMFWAKRLPKGMGYELNLEPVELNLNGDTLEDHVASMNHCIEDLIRKIPEQYMWSYKRFKSTHTYG